MDICLLLLLLYPEAFGFKWLPYKQANEVAFFILPRNKSATTNSAQNSNIKELGTVLKWEKVIFYRVSKGKLKIRRKSLMGRGRGHPTEEP